MDPLRETIERALGAQYDVLRLIGRGGMGAVYLARERLLDRLVAVKVLPHEAASEQGGRERFLREARTAAKLSHPNIVPLHSFAEAEGTLLYVMGYVEGESLEAKLAREGRIQGDAVRRILAEIAEALHYAHSQGVVHRDVKPDNILIEVSTGRAVLTDFGVARQAAQQGTLTRTGMIVGTPHYMSPEQAGGDALDGRSDVYALGVVGYRMLSGRLPFEGASLQEVLVAHMTREAPLLTTSQADAGAATAVMRCLRKQPAERWASGHDLATALRAGDHDIELPDELAALPSFGVKALLGLYYVEIALGAIQAYRPSPNDAATLVGSVAVLPVVVGAFAVVARRHGVSWREALTMQFWTPSTWWGWWPSRLRRPGDLWRRLPATVRWARSILTGAIVTFGVMVPALVLTLARVAGDRLVLPWLSRTFLWMTPVAVATMAVGVGLTFPWRRRFGLPKKIAERLSWEATWNNAKFWSRPEVAALLSSDQAVSAGPHTPDELVASIARDVAVLPETLRESVRGADLAARELARAIAAADAELAELARHADAGERERLERKVAALPTLTGEPDSRRDMRDLLSGQLALLERIDSRRRQLGDDKDRHLALLKNLWHQLATLRAEAVSGTRTVSDITGKVQAICDEAVRQREAIRTVEELHEGARS